MKVLHVHRPSPVACLAGLEREGTADVTIEKDDGTRVVVHMSQESVQDAAAMGVPIEDFALRAVQLGERDTH